jgi:hypothetical protein
VAMLFKGLRVGKRGKENLLSPSKPLVCFYSY